jgi:O-antigen ligase
VSRAAALERAARLGDAALVAAAALALFLVVALHPMAAAALPLAAAAGLVAWAYRDELAVPLGIPLGCVAALLAVAVWPAETAIAALVTAPAVVAWRFGGARPRHLRIAIGAVTGAALLFATPVAIAFTPGLVAAAALASAIAVLVARAPAWGLAAIAAVAIVALAFVAGIPAAFTLVVIVAVIAVLAWVAPAWALAAAVLLYGFEGSVKVLLGLDANPLPVGNREAGAFALDVALFAAVAGVLLSDRLETPRAIWRGLSRAERVAIGLLGAWLALSVLQIAQSGDLVQGLKGFRQFQLYTLLAIPAAALFALPRGRLRAAQVLLGIGLVVSLYAALRVATGPAPAEREFANVETVTAYGGAFRAVGSFSSAVGLSSFLAPLVVFSLIAGYLSRRLRVLAWIVATLALVGLLGSYGRASLFGVALGLLAAVGVLLVAADVPTRRKLAGVGLVAAVLVATYGGLQIASQAAPELRDRAEGVLNPLDDESIQLRLDNWEGVIRDVRREPLGQGIGAVGAASADTRRDVVTTDNSYLKVAVEQGIPGAIVFLGGILGAVVLMARRLRHAADERRAIGLAALAGFVTFLGISVLGEYVEQPGKVLAWGLLGTAAAAALTRVKTDPDTPRS